jgi:hypothetical protein
MMSRAQLLRLKNAPRRRGGTARLRIAWAGMNRPLAKTKNDPPRSTSQKSGIGRAWVMPRVIRMANPTNTA